MGNIVIKRPDYINRLMGFKDKQLIKAITGIRRCGKSFLFSLYQQELLKCGIEPSQIISINLEDPDYGFITDWHTLYSHIMKLLLPDKMNYVFIDEAQNIPDFQKAADGLFIRNNVDLYITGSNSRLKSGEWATLLGGRYVEINMLPLSLKEYSEAYPGISPDELLAKYISGSSFPYALQMEDWQQTNEYLGGIYSTIVLKDIADNSRIRVISRLEKIIRFMAGNIGSITSIKKISDTLTSSGLKMLPMTAQSYIQALEQSFIFYRAGRYDIKGKKILQSLDKYYISDIGIRHYLLGRKAADTGHILENIVFLELLRRRNRVYIGKADNLELDFVAENSSGLAYYQVSQSIITPETMERELRPFSKIKDNYPKYLLTLDRMPYGDFDGIRHINIADWLLAN